MIKVNSQNIKNFREKGWCILKSGFDKKELLSYKKKVGEIEVQAKKINYKPGRIYYDYIQSFNLAAVEAPLNKLVCNNEVLNFFQKLEIGNAIKKIAGWENTICTLIRLFCMGNYNYSGHWHQDFDTNWYQDYDTNKEGKYQGIAIQASIILKDEKGFHIIKKEKQNEFYSNEIHKKLKIHSSMNVLPTLIDKKFYDIVSLKSGDIFLFDPFLYHKGSCNHKRLQFHMRFFNFNDEKKFNFFKLNGFDFYFDQDKIYNYLRSENEIIKTIKNIVKRASIYHRLKNSINYFFPLFNFIYYLKQRRLDKQFNYEIFANTAYQKKIDDTVS